MPLACSLACNPQVMPGFRGQDKDPSGKISAEGMARWRARMHQFAHRTKAVAKKRPKIDALQKQRLANKYHCKGFDNALHLGAGVSCADFVVQKPPSALAANERRFMIKVSDCPPSVQAASSDRELRSCIQDRDTGKTRLELCWSSERKLMHCHVDEGGDNLTNKFWLYLRMHMRGWVWIDPTHRRENNWKNSCSEAGAAWCLKDMALICSIGSAPWGKCGHFDKYSDAMLEYTTNFDCNDELWVLAYPYVAAVFFEGKLPINWKSDECRQELWHTMVSSTIMKFKGSKAKLGRWYQTTCRWRAVKLELGFLAVAILYIGVTLKWYRDLGASPLTVGLMAKMEAMHST